MNAPQTPYPQDVTVTDGPADDNVWNTRTPWTTIVLRMIISLAAATIAISIADVILPGFSAGEPIRFSFWVLLLNGLIVPLVVRLAYPIIVYTAGLASLVLNAALVMLAGAYVPTVQVDTFWDGLGVSLIITIVTMTVNWLLAINDDSSYQRAVVAKAARRAGRVDIPLGPDGVTPAAGVIFLEIDGCSEHVFRRALRNGWMPNLGRLVREGSHTITPWETDLSSQTGASQAGLLIGSDEGLVAFRWYERDRARVVVSSKPKDAQEIEDRLSTGRGLLAAGGVSRNNLFSGDAPDSIMTLSQVLRPGGAGKAYSQFFSNPYNVMNVLVRAIRDIGDELLWGRRMKRRGIWPRLDHKGWKYPLVRVGTTVVLPDLTCQVLIGDLMRGVPSAYATFVGYDEVAHHDGVERQQSLAQLRSLDRSFARVMNAARHAPRPYRFVILSDHGQSHGATFKQRFGITLEDLVRAHLSEGTSVEAMLSAIEPEGQLGGALTESGQQKGIVSAASRSVAKPDASGSVLIDGSGERDDATASGEATGDVLVMASGNLGLVYLRERTTRATLEELDAHSPGLVTGVATHPGVGFVLVETEHDGPVAIGPRGRHFLASGRVDGVDPVAPFGPHAVRKLRRHNTFEHMPDLLVVSMYDEAADEVAAFEELIGSHGGMGGEQTHAFVLHPASWPEPEELLLGAPDVHQQLIRWMELEGARPKDFAPPSGGDHNS